MLSHKIYKKISDIGIKKWDECSKSHNPFLSYTFLKNLEDSNSVGDGTSWLPNYLCIIENNNMREVLLEYFSRSLKKFIVLLTKTQLHILQQARNPFYRS